MFKKVPYGLAALTVLKVEKAHGVQLQQHQQKWNADQMNVQVGAEHRHHHKHHHQQLAQSIPACDSTGCKTETAAPSKLQKDTDPWDKDYFVPNFGVDHDILDTHHNVNVAGAYCTTGNCGQPWVVAAQERSIPACDSTGCKTETAAAAKLQKDTDPWDKDYFVPNFGVDHDILDTHHNLGGAKAYCAGGDARCGQPWQVAAQQASIPACDSTGCKTETAAAAKLQKDTDPWKKDYFIPNFGVDHDILDTHHNRAGAEAFCAGGKCGQPWVVAAQSKSIPACDSTGCKTETAADAKLQKDTDKWDKDYFVPNFGVDHDILATHKHLNDAKAYCAGDAARCGQQWYVAAQRNSESVPACNSLGCATKSARDGEKETGGAVGGSQLNDAVGLPNNSLAQSIPACDSTGCKTETAAPAKLQKDTDKWDKDYFVPNFGVDHDILDTHHNLNGAGAYCKDGNCGQPWVVAAQSDSDSRPACNSVECKTGTAAPKVATPLWAVHYEPEKGKEEVQLKDWNPDEDEIDSYRHMNLNEHQDYRMVQANKDKQSDPLHTSVPFEQDKSLGEDYQRYWNNVNWNTHAGKAYSLVQLDAEANSDPICNSSGCTQYKHPEAADSHPVDYPVPNFGLDSDILDSGRHMKNAQQAYGMPTFNSTEIPPEAYDSEFELVQYPTPFQPEPNTDAHFCDNNGFCAGAQGAHPQPVIKPSLVQLAREAPPHCNKTGFCGEGVGPHRAPDALTGSRPPYSLNQKTSDPICSSTDDCGNTWNGHGGLVIYPRPVIEATSLTQKENEPHCNDKGFCADGLGAHRAVDSMTGLQGPPAQDQVVQVRAPPHCNKTGFCGEGVGPHRAPDALTGSRPAYSLHQMRDDPTPSSSGWVGPYYDEPLHDLEKAKYPAYETGKPLDADIVTTQNHQANAETGLGNFEDPRPFLQYYH